MSEYILAATLDIIAPVVPAERDAELEQIINAEISAQAGEGEE